MDHKWGTPSSNSMGYHQPLMGRGYSQNYFRNTQVLSSVNRINNFLRIYCSTTDDYSDVVVRQNTKFHSVSRKNIYTTIHYIYIFLNLIEDLTSTGCLTIYTVGCATLIMISSHIWRIWHMKHHLSSENCQVCTVTARKRSLGQGNIFAPVCHSVPEQDIEGIEK